MTVRTWPILRSGTFSFPPASVCPVKTVSFPSFTVNGMPETWPSSAVFTMSRLTILWFLNVTFAVSAAEVTFCAVTSASYPSGTFSTRVNAAPTGSPVKDAFPERSVVFVATVSFPYMRSKEIPETLPSSDCLVTVIPVAGALTFRNALTLSFTDAP